MPVIRTGAALAGALLILLGLLLPVELDGTSKPLLVWMFKVFEGGQPKPDKFWAIYTVVVFFPISSLLLAIGAVITALRPPAEGGTPWDVTVPGTQPAVTRDLAGGIFGRSAVGVLIWGQLISAAIFSVAIEGVFVGGIFYAVSAAVQLTWAMCLFALILGIAGFIVASLTAPPTPTAEPDTPAPPVDPGAGL